MQLIAELKRRKVFKVGAAYLVVAWLAVQAASIAFPAFEAPPWALRVFILVAMLGFPASLAFAWVFDVTPEGLKTEPVRRGTIGFAVMAAALVALALAWYYRGQPSYRAGDAPVVAQTTVAVLPFANMSGKAEEDYFSDGMTEELLNVLAKIPKLGVAARTSVFEFKGKGGDVREIGRKLGVSHIVEGSIRREGAQVRVTAQLVRVTDGLHVWSESYDREVKSVFALQDEIARRIGEQLQVKLGVAGMGAARADIEPAAYDEFLKGRALLRERQDLPTAIAHFKAAGLKAPGFAANWSSLSLACEAIFSYLKMTPAEQADMVSCASDAAQRAATLDPDSAASEHALATVARTRFRYADAERHYLRAIALDPGYPEVREDYAELLFQVGRVEDSAEAARQLVQLDPYFVVAWNRVRDAAIALDRRAEVEAVTQRLREVRPNGIFGKITPLEYALAYGRADEARAALAAIQSRGPDGVPYAVALLPWALGDPGVDDAKVHAAIADAPAGAASAFFIARRDVPGFNAYVESDGSPIDCYYFSRLYRSRPAGHAMLRDPSVKAKLIEYGFVAYWREKGWPAGCRPLGDDDFECGIDVAEAAKP